VESHAPVPDAPISSVPPPDTRAPDAQVALTCLDVLCQGSEPEWLNLIATDLRHAEPATSALRSTRLVTADLRGARLVETGLEESGLTGADLREAPLEGARASARTRWPEGFDAPGAGVARAEWPGSPTEALSGFALHTDSRRCAPTRAPPCVRPGNPGPRPGLTGPQPAESAASCAMSRTILFGAVVTRKPGRPSPRRASTPTPKRVSPSK